MGRPVVLSNGRLAVGLNENGLVQDFYYPYVGLDNLTTARSEEHKIGVWVDGEFSWTDSKNWKSNIEFGPDSLISSVTLSNKNLGISLVLHDFVDCHYDAFCRLITVKNCSDQQKNVRIFMHQVFQISRGGRADTALYVPDDNYILDYKGRCCLLIGGRTTSDNKNFDQYAVGNYGIEGKEGTYKDAEDGELSNHAVEHGGVDSVLRFSFTLPPKDRKRIDYWVAAAESQFDGEKIQKVLNLGLKARLDENIKFWQKWFEPAAGRIAELPSEHQSMVKKSLLIIKAHADSRGGVIASCDSSIYNYGRDYYSYVWPRDGAYAIWPLIRLGLVDEPKRFFEFCADILHPEGYLMHKYQPDKAIGSTWHPLMHDKREERAIQEDETAIVIIMLGEFYAYTKDTAYVREMFEKLVTPAVNFMYNFLDDSTGLPHASYDLWEEKFLTTTYTTACVHRALRIAADFAREFNENELADKWTIAADKIYAGREIFKADGQPGYRKGYLLQDDGSLSFDETIDVSSLYGVMTFGFFDPSETSFIDEATEFLRNKLSEPSGHGVARYNGDKYFLTDDESVGNPWMIATLWIAQYYIRAHKLDKADGLMKWVLDTALPSGVLPEQVNPKTNEAISVLPLVWSHSEYINTVLDMSQIQKTQIQKRSDYFS